MFKKQMRRCKFYLLADLVSWRLLQQMTEDIDLTHLILSLRDKYKQWKTHSGNIPCHWKFVTHRKFHSYFLLNHNTLRLSFFFFKRWLEFSCVFVVYRHILTPPVFSSCMLKYPVRITWKSFHVSYWCKLFQNSLSTF